MVIASDIRVELDGKPVLNGIDFRANPGEVTAIIGPNGSGKSTLLRVLTGEIRTPGRVALNGLPVAKTPHSKLAAIRAVQAQSTSVAFSFDVEEVVRFGHSAGWAAADRTVPERALSRVGLAGFGQRPYHSLSGGEQQRVHFARALAQVWNVEDMADPYWLFLDEPMSSLDIGHQLLVVKLLRDFARSGGGIVVVMHDLNLTAMLADRVCLLKEGRVLCEGAPSQTLAARVLSEAYNCKLHMGETGRTGLPYFLPQEQDNLHGF